MNYLAHIYLSGENELITIGNFVADGIKGKAYKKYNPYMQVGIMLHRNIDTFTDAHPIVKQSTKRLHDKYGHYSGIIVDILYDHFLAKNWGHFSPIPLNIYVANFYASLEANYELLPFNIQKMMPYMITDNWLLSYASIDGISRVLQGMNNRTKNQSGMNRAVQELEIFYPEFEHEFFTFFEALKEFSQIKLIEQSNVILNTNA